MGTIKPRRLFQRIKSLVNIEDLELDPPAVDPIYTSNIFGRVFSFLVGKSVDGFKFLLLTTTGCLMVADRGFLYNPLGGEVFAIGAGGATVNCSVLSKRLYFWSDGDDMKVKFIYTDGTDSGWLYFTQNVQHSVTFSLSVKQIMIDAAVPGVDWLYVNYFDYR